jgi:beta-N-acetylhexosaminidase
MTMTARIALALALLLALGTTAAMARDEIPVPEASNSPAPLASAEAALNGDRVAEIMAGMSPREKVGQLFMSRVYGFQAENPAPGARRSNAEYLGVDDARQLFTRFPVGAIVYFEYAGNLQHAEQIARLSNGIQRAALEAGTVPVLISTDQEHGIIERLGPPATRFPGNMALGATRSDELAREAARVTGEELRAVGIGQNLAPVADVNNNPANPVIGVRSFGSRPRLVATMTKAQVRGFEDDADVAATVKHFPGHGDTNIDSHVGLPTIRHSKATWRAIDAPPFEAAIEAGVDIIMTAHVRVPSLDPSGRPATLSKPILSGILRDTLGYEGVIMTDSLTMAAVRAKWADDRVPVLALKAGADLLADPPHLPSAFRGVMAALESGEITEARLDRSVARILRLKERLGLLDEPMVDVDAVAEALGSDEHEAVAEAVGEASITVLRDRKSWLPLPQRWQVQVTGAKPEGAADLARALRAGGRSVRTDWTRTSPGAAQIRRAVRGASKSDVTIVVTERLGAYRAQRELVRRLLADGGRVIVVYAGSPYDAGWFPSAPAQIAAYSTVPVSMRGLGRVLSGKAPALGTLPVRVPQPGRPKVALYPFGHGLTDE